MIEITCSCGGQFEVINEQVAQRVRCPKCGTLASDIIAQAQQGDDMGEATAEETQEPRFNVACAIHPDRQATHNCMNCAKPLCMVCVRENGYYCSDECRDAVDAAEPSIATDRTPVGAGDEKLERTLGIIFGLIKKAVLLGLVLGLGYVGFLTYQKYWGPRPQITASLDIVSGEFKAVTLDATRTIVQTDDELSLINLTTSQKVWKVDLHPLEEPYTPPKSDGAAPESEFSVDPSKFSDPLMLADVKGDNAVLRSYRQLVVVNTQTGAVKWKFFQPDTMLDEVLVHDDGVLCVLSTRGKGNKTSPPRAACFAFVDGHELWADANASAYAAAVPIPGKRIVTAKLEKPKSATPGSPEEQEFTASGMDVGAFRGAMYGRISRAMASGSMDVEEVMDTEETEKDLPAQNYTLRFQSLENGAEAGLLSVSLKGPPQIDQVGPFACVVAGHDLYVFENGSQPLWQTTLPAAPRVLATGGEIFAVGAGDQVIALDAKTGQQKWVRTKLKASRVVVGLDGGVYATVKMSRNDFRQSEAKDFRIDDISTGGTTDPRAPVTFLMKLDAKNGATSWGVQNIGGDLVFDKDKVYVFDTTTEIRLLSNTGLNTTFHSIHCLSPRNGKELWTYINTGTVHHHVILNDKAFFVTTEGNSLGSLSRPSYVYRFCMVERK